MTVQCHALMLDGSMFAVQQPCTCVAFLIVPLPRPHFSSNIDRQAFVGTPSELSTRGMLYHLWKKWSRLCFIRSHSKPRVPSVHLTYAFCSRFRLSCSRRHAKESALALQPLLVVPRCIDHRLRRSLHLLIARRMMVKSSLAARLVRLDQ